MPIHSKGDFQSTLREPLGASVTFYEATAPVKLPTRHGPLAYPGLETKTEKSGISTTAPSRLASKLHSLPPILHNSDPIPMSGCSKAPRGLFVLSRVTRIFTGLAISPSPSLRQRPSRYAFPAGRNLPDKGLRYLRTVIVTAAVHWGFSSALPPDKSGFTPLLNLPALGRRQPVYIGFPLSTDLCFC